MKVCLLRLSALGDVTHVLPLVHALRKHYGAELELTWVIARRERAFLSDVPEVEFIVYDKAGGWSAYRALKQQLAQRRFDVLLLMQLALRAGLVSTAVTAARRIGYPKVRSAELHSLFINERAQRPDGGHVIDQFLAFGQALGASTVAPVWRLPVSDAARAWVQQQLGRAPYAVISPCSSKPERDWHVDGYAQVAQRLATDHGLQVVLAGGPSARERRFAQQIEQRSAVRLHNLVGQDTLPQLLALLASAKLVVSPDSGPAHFASALNTPVIGLYACTDADRSGPYRFRDLCVNRYAEAAKAFANQAPANLKWGDKIHHPQAMNLVTITDVQDRIEQWAQSQ